MQTIRVSATHARNNFFELLNQVAEGKEIVIEKDNKVVASMISSKKAKKQKNSKLVAALKKSYGIMKDDPDGKPLLWDSSWELYDKEHPRKTRK